MLTIFADNTMNLGSIADRQDANVVTTSTIIGGLERLAAYLMRALVPVGGRMARVHCAAIPATSCRSFEHSKPWQLGLVGMKKPLGHGQPVGSGRILAG